MAGEGEALDWVVSNIAAYQPFDRLVHSQHTDDNNGLLGSNSSTSNAVKLRVLSQYRAAVEDRFVFGKHFRECDIRDSISVARSSALSDLVAAWVLTRDIAREDENAALERETNQALLSLGRRLNPARAEHAFKDGGIADENLLKPYLAIEASQVPSEPPLEGQDPYLEVAPDRLDAINHFLTVARGTDSEVSLLFQLANNLPASCDETLTDHLNSAYVADGNSRRAATHLLRRFAFGNSDAYKRLVPRVNDVLMNTVVYGGTPLFRNATYTFDMPSSFTPLVELLTSCDDSNYCVIELNKSEPDEKPAWTIYGENRPEARCWSAMSDARAQIGHSAYTSSQMVHVINERQSNYGALTIVAQSKGRLSEVSEIVSAATSNGYSINSLVVGSSPSFDHRTQLPGGEVKFISAQDGSVTVTSNHRNSVDTMQVVYEKLGAPKQQTSQRTSEVS